MKREINYILENYKFTFGDDEKATKKWTLTAYCWGQKPPQILLLLSLGPTASNIEYVK